MPPTHAPAPRTLAWLIVGVAALLTAAAIIALAAPQSAGTAPATCLDPGATLSPRCFCEAIRQDLLRQPANALSSLAFVVAGGAAYRRRRALPPGTRERALAPALAATLVALGAGSLAYHGALTFAGQLLDVQGMYLLGLLLVVGALWRAGTLTARQATAALVVALGVLIAAQVGFPDARRWLFAVVLVPGILLERRLAPSSRPLRLAVLALGVAYAVWVADDRGWWCQSTSWLQGHALWHLLTAVSGGLVVEHYLVTARARAMTDVSAETATPPK
ncbi:MAG TPA: ceramidase domain-containing protein [Dermatophilaceae bacterium]|nr:ceramidase domain-containing protein [Dermatophilaceae bacterium]